jgi:RNA polymerase sigma-70 factor (sigma-E family)
VAVDEQFEAFVRATGPGLLRFAHTLTLDPHAAADLTQETFVRVGVAWRRVRPDQNPVGYAQRTMVNAFLNGRRRSWRETPVAATADAGRDDPALDEVDAVGAVRHLLAGLPPRQRAAVAMRYLLDLPDEVIADQLGISTGTVRSQISRGLATLRSAAPTTTEQEVES